MNKFVAVAIFLLATLVGASSYADDSLERATMANELANENFIGLIMNKLNSSEYSSATSIVESSLREAGITPQRLVSCSSRDGTKDCFCGSMGCWRTESDCGCDSGIEEL